MKKYASLSSGVHLLMMRSLLVISLFIFAFAFDLFGISLPFQFEQLVSSTLETCYYPWNILLLFYYFYFLWKFYYT